MKIEEKQSENNNLIEDEKQVEKEQEEREVIEGNVKERTPREGKNL